MKILLSSYDSDYQFILVENAVVMYHINELTIRLCDIISCMCLHDDIRPDYSIISNEELLVKFGNVNNVLSINTSDFLIG